jgi:hypothetical protein
MFHDTSNVSKFYGGILFLLSPYFVRSLKFLPWMFGQLKKPAGATLVNNAKVGGQKDTRLLTYPFLHTTEYPDDDFSHILGMIINSKIY